MNKEKLPTLVELLQWRAKNQPEQKAYGFLVDGIKEQDYLTYGELDKKAQIIASFLQSKFPVGSRVILIYPQGLEFISAFFGCLYAGMIAIPTPAPESSRLKRLLPRITSIADNAQATILLTNNQLLATINELDWENISKFSTAEILEKQLSEKWLKPEINPQTLAYLQYTSGSTSQPKGVMLTHKNLMCHLADLQESCGYDTNSITVTWMPYFHDYGLVEGILEPLYNGHCCYLMSPLNFIRHPLNWLQAISHYQVTHSQAPNFAYAYCVEKIAPQKITNLNLNSWQSAGIGAEMIQVETIENFSNLCQISGFKKESFCPGYGLAEATLGVTNKSENKPPIYLTVDSQALSQNQIIETENGSQLVGVGKPLKNTKIVIINPETCTELSQNLVGEIWVSSSGVAEGYWDNLEVTKHTFQAYLDTGEGPFLRTGDLGFIKDEELFITGRLKDLIIIRGQNYYPQDIEWSVEKCHPQLRNNASAVFAIEKDGNEQIVIVTEVEGKINNNIASEDIINNIRQSIAHEYELPLYAVVLIKRGTIPKTSSGKIQRQVCRCQFLNNNLEIISSWYLATKNIKQNIKINNFELETIESILNQHPQVEKTLVITQQDYLIAYIIPDQKQVPNPTELRTYLQEKLPEYMIPTVYIPLEAFPLTPNGKIDIKALPKPEREHSLNTEIVLPRTEIEKKVAQIWQKVLWLDQEISINDNFFFLGGNSLLAANLITEIEQEFKRELPVLALSQLNTIADLVTILDQEIPSKKVANLANIIKQENTLNPEIYHQLLAYTSGWPGTRINPNSLVFGHNLNGTKPPLFWVLQGYRELSQLAKYLGEEQPIYGMRSAHLIIEEYTEENLQELAHYYTNEIISIQPHEPYFLAGNCQSTFIVTEIAKQLQKQGKTVALLCLLENIKYQPYQGKIALIFGRDSDNYNPYKLYSNPELTWQKLYPLGFSVKTISGDHGEYFNEPNIQDLAKTITELLAETSQEIEENKTIFSQEKYQAKITVPETLNLPPNQSLQIPVTVTNISPVKWEKTEKSNLKLGNHWLNKEEEYLQWLDGISDLPQAILPQETAEILLTITTPELEGNYLLEIDLVEEGVTWFKNNGSETATIMININSKSQYINPEKLPNLSENSQINDQKTENQGDIFFAQGDYKNAIKNYQNFLTQNTKNVLNTYYKLAYSYYKTAALESAFSYCDKYLENEQENPQVYYLMAEIKNDLKESDSAILNYQKVIALNYHEPKIYQKLGQLLEEKQLFSEAKETYQKAINLYSNNQNFYLKMANLERKEGNLEKTINLYQQLLEIAPDGQVTWYNYLGNIYIQQKDFTTSFNYLQKALEIEPNNIHTNRNLAQMNWGKKDLESAIYYCEKVLEIDDSDASANNILSTIYLQRNELDKVSILMNKALNKNPNNPYLNWTFANFYRQKGNLDEAIKYYQKSVEFGHPSKFTVWRNIADTYQQQGNLKEAMINYQEALKLQPNNEEIQTMINNLNTQIESRKIPKNLILFWHNQNEIPDKINEAIQKTKAINTDYNVIFADDNYMIKFIKEKYDKDILDLYQAIKIPAARSDLARLMLLYEYGGIYLDAAMETCKSIDTIIINNPDLILVRRDDFPRYLECKDQAHFTNSIIGTIPKLDFLKDAILLIINHLKYRKYNNVWYSTGPYALNFLFNKYQPISQINTLYFSQLNGDFFVYKRVSGVSNEWVKQQIEGIVDSSYYGNQSSINLPIISILGMHRSGTSCLAGSLQKTGIFTGKVVEFTSDNLKGQIENLDIQRLNEFILKQNQGSWDNPPNQINFTEQNQQERDKIIAEFKNITNVWMFKDPRTILTLKFWQEKIDNLQLVGTFRHPLKVALSLYQRDKKTLQEGLSLWIHYNKILLEEYQKSPFPIICFDVPQEKYFAQLKQVINTLNQQFEGLNLEAELATQFYDSKLIHQEKIAISPTELNQLSDENYQNLLTQADKLYQQLIEITVIKKEELSLPETNYYIPLEETLKSCQEILKIQPNNLHVYWIMGNIYSKENDLDEAINSYQKAIEIAPEKVNFYLSLADSYRKQKNYAEALKIYQQILSFNAENAEIYCLMSTIYEEKADIETAIHACNQGLKVQPKYFNIYDRLGRLYQKQNRLEEAINIYNQAIELEPHHLSSLNILADIYINKNELNLATIYSQKALTIQPNNPYVNLTFAKLNRKQGKLDQAIEYYQKAAEFGHPSKFTVWRNIAEVNKQQGDIPGAIDNYQKALELQPTNEQIKTILDNLKNKNN